MKITVKLFLISLVLFVFHPGSALCREKIIIGVHGLGDKQPDSIYTNWWKASIAEGLTKYTSCDQKETDFELYYWADLLYKVPMHSDTNYYFDDKFDNEPYYPGEFVDNEKYSRFSEKFKTALYHVKSMLTARSNIPVGVEITDFVLEKTLRDLAFYFENKIKVKTPTGEVKPVREAIDEGLIKILRKYKDRDILIVGHSMGAIIAWHVLQSLQVTDPDIKVKYFITAGSPISIPPVLDRLQALMSVKKLKCPENITEGWLNYSDPNDKVCFDPILEDNMQKNSTGVEVNDILVKNDYVSPAGKANKHKEYGYLRTKKIARVFCNFINE